MSIGLTTVILFAVFGILLFLSCPISVSIVIASIVTAVSSLSWDQITFITMQKMNSGVESFSLLAIPPCQLCQAVCGLDSRFPGPGQHCGQHALWRAVRFIRGSCICHGRLYLSHPEGRGLRPCLCHGRQHCLGSHRTPDPPYQRIHRVLHGSRRRVHIHSVHGRIHSRHTDGCWLHGGGFHLRQKA